MKTNILLLLLVLAGCKNSPAKTDDPAPAKGNPYCYFAALSLYHGSEIFVNTDTISTYFDGTLVKKWISADYKQYDTTYRGAGDPFTRLIPPANDEYVFLKMNQGKAPVKYEVLPADMKTKLSAAIPGANLDKVQRFKDSYFLIISNDTSSYPHIYVFDNKTTKTDTITWVGQRTENSIEDVFVYDFKKDGYADLFVIWKDGNRQWDYGVTAISTSPAWICEGKIK